MLKPVRNAIPCASRRISIRLPRSIWILLAAAVVVVAGLRSVADEQPAGLKKGWKSRTRIPAVKVSDVVFFRESRVTIWEEQGWLVVRRATIDDDLEWQVVLARSSDPARPEIDVQEATGSIEVRYRGYFIRESRDGKLRIFRERKTEKSPDWPLLKLEGERGDFGGSGGSDAYLEFLGLDQWCWLQSGGREKRPDLWIRLQPVTQRKGEASRGNAIFGVTSGAGGPVEMFYGDCQAQDEGDLFIGNRVTLDDADLGLEDSLLHDALGTDTAPALAGDEWHNTEDALSLAQLEGKVVLLHFWATWCDASTKNLSRLEELHKEFGERGLVIIGIHSARRSDDAGRFLKEREFSLPIVIDNGQTAKQYRIGAWPAYFLIDKSGKVAWGFGMAPPTSEQIEKLLK
jgi:peroxiredoxin